MALVDYASSSGEEDDVEEGRNGGVSEAEAEGGVGGGEQESGMNTVYGPQPSSFPPPRHHHSSSSSSSPPHPNRTSNVPSQSVPTIALPDASLLFASPGISSQHLFGSDHSSRVAEAVNINASRKRDSNGAAHQFLQNKTPRLNIQRSRNMSDRSTSLVPPQLRGRSNIATEDIGRLFVHRHSGNP